MIPSTGGSDEAHVPKPRTSQVPAPSPVRENVSKEASDSSPTDAANSSPNTEMVNFKVAEVAVNPLVDFEPAKFASKTHGLITSYSANTHQGI